MNSLQTILKKAPRITTFPIGLILALGFVIDEIHCTFTGKPPDETEQSGYIKPHIHGNLHGLGFVQTCAV